MRWFVSVVTAILLASGGVGLAEAPAPGLAATVVTPVTSADVNSAGQPIVFPQKDGHITAAVYTVASGAVLPVHKHPFQRLGYVLSGTLRVTNVERGTSVTYKPGDMVLEAVNVWHKGENIGPNPLRLLVIDLSEKGAATTVMKK